MNPAGTSNADDETGAWEKFDFCIVISIKVVLEVPCVPAAEESAGAGCEGGGVAFFLWKPPSTELPNALPIAPLMVCGGGSLEPCPLDEFEAAAGAACPEPWAAPGPVPLPPMRVTSMTRVPCSLAISLAICAMASCDPGWPLNIWLIAGFEFVICAFHAEKSTPAISFSPNLLSKSCISFTSGGSGAIQASVVTT